MNIANTT